MARRTIRLATRGSPLALRQAETVGALLSAAVPGVVVEPVIVRTTGDREATASLDRIGGQGAFTGEVQAAVLDGRADAAVHSAKDLPALTPGGLCLRAVPERGDTRDALVGRTLAEIPPGGVVATGSARRRAQLASLRPDLTFADLRGNMATRARHAADGSADAGVVAVAAFDRLGWRDRIAEILPVPTCCPQVGQGALAVECRADDEATLAALGAVDHVASHMAVEAERAFLAGVGGDCSVPVAATATVGPTGRIHLDAMVATGDGRVVVRATLDGDRAGELGRRMARHLMEEAGGAAVVDWDRCGP